MKMVIVNPNIENPFMNAMPYDDRIQKASL